MFRTLQEAWKDLDRSILVGERYEKNMRGIGVVGAVIVAVNLVTGTPKPIETGKKAALIVAYNYYGQAAALVVFICSGSVAIFPHNDRIIEIPYAANLPV